MKTALLMTAVSALLATGCFADDYPQVSISNGLVKAKVYIPDATNGFYRGTRFDWAGVIADLQFAGHNYYPQWFQRMDPKVRDFVYEGNDIVAGPCTAITGTPEEFVNGLGFDETKPGGTFIKIGVGVLRKPDDARYENFRVYEIVDGGKWTVNKKAESVEFIQKLADPSSGYAYEYRKTVSLTPDKAQMVLSHVLRNIGARGIHGSVYDHNFLYLDGQAPGPDFKVTVPFEIRQFRSGSSGSPGASGAPASLTGAGGSGNAGRSGPNVPAPSAGGIVQIRGNELTFTRTLSGEDRAQMLLQSFGAEAKDYDIRIENTKVGAGLHITGDRPLSREFLWSIKAPLSVEPYIDINIEPGSEFAWKITYDYYTLPTAPGIK